MKNVFTWWGDRCRQAMIDKAYDSLLAAADYFVERAQEYAPVDTGELRDGIGVQENPEAMSCSIVCIAPHSVFQEYGWYDISSTWHPPVAFMRNAMEDTRAEYPNIAIQFKLGEGSRYTSKAKAPQEGAPRHHTFQSESHHRIEKSAGSHTGA